MKWELKQKIIKWAFLGFGIILFLFALLFNSTYWTIDGSQGFSQLNGNYKIVVNGVISERKGEPNATALLLISIFIPLLVGIISILTSFFFKAFTKEDALKQNEKQYTNGLISFEQYKSNMIHIERFDLEKKKIRAEIEVEKDKLQKKIMKEVEKATSQLKETTNEED